MAQTQGTAAPRHWAPDAVTIIFALCFIVMIVSAIMAAAGVTAVRPGSGELVVAQNLFSAENLRRLFSEMPQTFAHFHPLGMVVVVMLGAGMADKVGLFDAALGKFLRAIPSKALLPGTIAIGICSHVAVDASYFVYIPLAGYAFKAAGRDPFVGICAAFAGVSGGYGANFLVTPTDAIIYGLTENAAQTIDASVSVDLVSNYFIMVAYALVVIAVVTFVTRSVIEPRLARHDVDHAGGEEERREARPGALAWSGAAMAAVLLASLALALPEGAPLRDEAGGLKPFYDSLVAVIFLMFFIGGIVFGVVDKRIGSDRDVMRLTAEGIYEVAPFFMLAFAAAHFGAFLNWSNLAVILAAKGSAGLNAIDLTGIPLIIVFYIMAALLNILMASASGKWALMAPAVVPMLMSAGLSPELITAAYRIADSATNIITPVSLLPVVLIFAQRYRPEVSLPEFIGIMIPYAAAMFVCGLLLLVAWVLLGVPLGPSGAEPFYQLPGTS